MREDVPAWINITHPMLGLHGTVLQVLATSTQRFDSI